MKFRSLLLPATLILFAAPTLRAEATLEDVLAEVKSLKSQVATLEARLDTLENAPPPAPEPVEPQRIVTSKPSKPKKEGPRWWERFGIDLSKADTANEGKWTEPENWDKIYTGMPEEEVFEILGIPDNTLKALHKKVDHVHLYKGYANNQTVKIVGKVKIFKDKVVSIVRPELSL